MAEVRIVERDPTVEKYQRFRTAVGWHEMPSDSTAIGLPGALYSVVLESEGMAVGCGRVVGVTRLYFYVQDMIVVPEFQGRGFGAQIMERVMGYVTNVARPGAFVGLMAAHGVEGFYERYGFRRRPDDRPGMFIV